MRFDQTGRALELAVLKIDVVLRHPDLKGPNHSKNQINLYLVGSERHLFN